MTRFEARLALCRPEAESEFMQGGGELRWEGREERQLVHLPRRPRCTRAEEGVNKAVHLLYVPRDLKTYAASSSLP